MELIDLGDPSIPPFFGDDPETPYTNSGISSTGNGKNPNKPRPNEYNWDNGTTNNLLYPGLIESTSPRFKTKEKEE